MWMTTKLTGSIYTDCKSNALQWDDTDLRIELSVFFFCGDQSRQTRDQCVYIKFHLWTFSVARIDLLSQSITQYESEGVITAQQRQNKLIFVINSVFWQRRLNNSHGLELACDPCTLSIFGLRLLSQIVWDHLNSINIVHLLQSVSLLLLHGDAGSLHDGTVQ